MEANLGFILTSILVATFATLVVRLLNWIWFRPRKWEKFLRKQGYNGNSYRILLGDLKDLTKALKEEQPKSIGLWDDIVPHIFYYYMQTISKYGKNSFIWFGPSPCLNIADPKLIKEIFRKPYEFPKPFSKTSRTLAGGLTFLEGETWAKHRKIINPAFHIEKLKNMVPAVELSCSKMLYKWKTMVSSSNKGCEIDVWPYLEDLAGDVISRTSFGSSYEEGIRIFQLQQERVKLLMNFLLVPGWRFLPTKANRRVKAISNEIKITLRSIIEKRQQAMEKGEGNPCDDLLGILLESNSKFIQEDGNKNPGMSIEEVIEECKAFYLAGSETVSSLLVWTMILLCKYPEWQTKAREEVMRVFGTSTPTYEGLNHLKMVTMILHEVLRLYPTAVFTMRYATKTVELENLTIPEGLHVTLLIGLLNYDPEIWGDDVKEFKPQRFSEGVLKKPSFMPFGAGPRVCIGQNYAMIEAKMALAMILQQFSFQLSPSYLHAPFAVMALLPQYGAPLILHKLD